MSLGLGLKLTTPRGRNRPVTIPQTGLFAFWDLRNLAPEAQTIPSTTGQGGDLQIGPTTDVDANEPTKVGMDGLQINVVGGDVRTLTFPSIAKPYSLGFVARDINSSGVTKNILIVQQDATNKYLIQRYGTSEFRVYHNPTGANIMGSEVDQLFRLYTVNVPATASVTVYRDLQLVGSVANPTVANSTFNKLVFGNGYGGAIRALFVYQPELSVDALAELYKTLVHLEYLEVLGDVAPVSVGHYEVLVNGEHGFIGGQALPLSSDEHGQYVAYIDPDLHPRVGKRAQFGDPWVVGDLADTRENPFQLPHALDHHNYIALGVDGAGYLHVAGNHHDDSLHYVRSAYPRDVTRWVAQRMIGLDETSVTYPCFVRLNDGRLLFLYRDGRSGLGDYFLNRFDPSTQKWTRLHTPWISGAGESPYRSQVDLRADGSVHMTYNYRPVGGAGADNHDIYYIWSDDGGDTWKNVEGTTLTLPLVPTSPSLIWPIADHQGLVLAAPPRPDSNGILHTGYSRYDDTPTAADNGFHLWYDGTWHEEQMTFYGIHYDSAQTGVVQQHGNGVRVEGNRIFNLMADIINYPDRRVAKEITGGVFGPVFDYFVGADLLLSTPSDLQAKANGIYHQQASTAIAYGGPVSQYVPTWAQDYEWPDNYFSQLADGLRLPTGIIRKLVSTLPGAQTINTTANVSVNTPALTIPSTTPTRLFVRLRAGANLGTAANVYVAVQEGATVYGTIDLRLGETDYTTPWMPLRGSGTDVSVVARVNAGSATLVTATLEIGEWRD